MAVLETSQNTIEMGLAPLGSDAVSIFCPYCRTLSEPVGKEKRPCPENSHNRIGNRTGEKGSRTGL
jgi:hypothetical protein